VFIVGIGCILAAIVAAFLDGAAGFWPHVKNYLGW
jgi:hydroxyethylthiazole kinase-like sugar kinase family protein